MLVWMKAATLLGGMGLFVSAVVVVVAIFIFTVIVRVCVSLAHCV